MDAAIESSLPTTAVAVQPQLTPKQLADRRRKERSKTHVIKTLKLPIHSFGENKTEVIARWKLVLHRCREYSNAFYTLWYLRHFVKDHPRILRKHFEHDVWQDQQMAAWKAQKDIDVAAERAWKKLERKWRKATNGEMPFLEPKPVAKAGPKPHMAMPFEPMSKDFRAELEDMLDARFPDMHSRVKTLLFQQLREDLLNKNAPNSSRKRWQDILLNTGSLPTTTKGVARFDTQNATIYVDRTEKNDPIAKISIRIDRYDTDSSRGESHLDVVELRSAGNRVRSQIQKFVQIVNGEFEFAGSAITYSERDNEWHVHIRYWQPKKSYDFVPGTTAYLIPSRKRPYELRVPGVKRRFWPVGAGKYLIGQRLKIVRNRSEQRDAHRHTSMRNGHGRHQAEVSNGSTKERNRWKYVQRRANDSIVDKTIQYLKEHRIEHLVLFVPKSDAIKSRLFLTRTSKLENLDPSNRLFPTRIGRSGIGDNVSWNFAILTTQFSHRCSLEGVKLEVREIGKTEF